MNLSYSTRDPTMAALWLEDVGAWHKLCTTRSGAITWSANATTAPGLIYIDRHLLHEVTSPQAFDGLKLAGRRPWRIAANLATPDHNVPTTGRDRGIAGIIDETSRIQVVTLDDNCREFGIEQFDIRDVRQGIVHVVGPEQGATLPGMTIVCGDSHTSTHGAFGALAQGIGTSEVEHVLATQCLVQRKTGNMEIRTTGALRPGLYREGSGPRDHRSHRYRRRHRADARVLAALRSSI